MISFKGRHHQQDIILQCDRWYVAYSLSYRDLEEVMQERGYALDHSTIQRWVVHYAEDSKEWCCLMCSSTHPTRSEPKDPKLSGWRDFIDRGEAALVCVCG